MALESHARAFVLCGVRYWPSVQCYAICNADLAYNAMRCAVLTVLCGVRYWSSVQCYCICGTDRAYDAIVVCGTDRAYDAIAVYGTDRAYDAIAHMVLPELELESIKTQRAAEQGPYCHSRMLLPGNAGVVCSKVPMSIMLRACYAMSGTDTEYGAVMLRACYAMSASCYPRATDVWYCHSASATRRPVLS
eukprot:3940236-Rhodomonas_salina.9